MNDKNRFEKFLMNDMVVLTLFYRNILKKITTVGK